MFLENKREKQFWMRDEEGVCRVNSVLKDWSKNGNQRTGTKPRKLRNLYKLYK
jgi:hypothetical protein